MASKITDEQVITALISTDTKTEAAELLGVSKRTLYNRLNAEGFKERLEEAIKADAERYAEIRQSAVGIALETLIDVMQTEASIWSGVTGKDRIEAARIVLAYGDKLTTQER